MTINEAQNLLNNNGIPFFQTHYTDEADFYHHALMFPYTKKCKKEEIIALVVLSKNGKKNIELQFNNTSDGYRFCELWFGGYSFEMFDVPKNYLAQELLTKITEIMDNKVVFIDANNIKKQRWSADAVFSKEDADDALFGITGFQKAIEKINKPKSLWAKLTRSCIAYEVYDWNSYQLIQK